MSSALGNYIHYSNEGYQKYGLNRWETPTGDDSWERRTSVLETYKNSLKIHSSQQKDISGLEEFLNGLIYPQNDMNKTQIDNEVFSKLEMIANEVLQEKWAGFNFNPNTLTVYRTQIAANTTVIENAQLQSYANQLEKIINNLGKDDNLIKEIEEVKILINNIRNITEEKINFNDYKNLKTNLNKAFKLAKFNKRILGDAFEIWLSAANVYANEQIEEIGDDLVSDLFKKIDLGVSGGGTTKSIIKLSDMSTDYVNTEKIKKTLIDMKWSLNDELDAVVKSSQQKVDLTFNWNGKELAISAKNYGLRNETNAIHLLGGTSLLQILTSCSINYANHYLNIAGTGDSALQEARNNLKTVILAKALTGQDLKEAGLADTFVINARSKKHIYVFTMKDIFDAYKQNPEKINVGNDLIVKQSWSDSAQNRITNLLASLHAQKLRVSISSKEIIN